MDITQVHQSPAHLFVPALGSCVLAVRPGCRISPDGKEVAGVASEVRP